MSDGVLVQQGTFPTTPNLSGGQPRANRRREQVVADFWTQMLFDGRLYHIQIGTEDAPVASTAAIDDELVWALLDNNAGYALLPFAAQVRIANWTTATITNAMIEADLAKKRYSSGGTGFTPRNMRADAPYSFNGNGYVGTDITALAKSAVPDSVELKRGLNVEDAQATPDAAAANIEFNYNARLDALAAIVGLGSLLLHFGATTADVNGYGFLQAVQLGREDFV